MRILRWLAVIALVLPASAWADDHRADINGGGSYAKGSHLFGVHGGVAFTLPEPHRHWSVIAFETSVQSNGDETRNTLMSGLRYTLRVRDHVNHNHKVFVHTMIGLGQRGDGGRFDNDFAAAFGGGWEYIWNKPETKGVPPQDVNGFRVQLDYVIAQGETTNFPRLSFGYVRRLKK